MQRKVIHPLFISNIRKFCRSAEKAVERWQSETAHLPSRLTLKNVPDGNICIWVDEKLLIKALICIIECLARLSGGEVALSVSAYGKKHCRISIGYSMEVEEKQDGGTDRAMKNALTIIQRQGGRTEYRHRPPEKFVEFNFIRDILPDH